MMDLSEFVDIGQLQQLCEGFTALTGAATAIIDLQGNVLVAAGWQDICTRFHRRHPVTASRCRESDTILAGQLAAGKDYIMYRCRNGLVDVAVPIIIGSEHVANVFTGQFFLEAPDRESFIGQAEQYGFERTAYLDALGEVPVFTESQVQTMMRFFSRLARLIGEMGLRGKRLEETNVTLHRQQGHLEELIRARTAESTQVSQLQSAILDNSTVGIAFVRHRVFEWVNPRMPELFGIPMEQFQGASTRIIYPDDEAYQRLGNEAYPLLAQGKKAAFEVEMRQGNGTPFWCRLEGKALDHTKPQEGSIWIWEDITERKRAEEALAKRVVALTRPLGDIEGIPFEALFNLSDLQNLQDLFADAFGVAALITRPDGTPITQPSHFSTLCSQFIRPTPKGMRNCMRSDAIIGQHNPKGPNVQSCLSAGLCNAGASITVGGRHVANWLIGQVRNEAQEEEQIMKYAHEIGAEEAAFREAYRSVPVMSQEQFERIAHLLFAMANQLSTVAYQNIQQARFITERQQAEEALRASLEEKTVLLKEIHHRVKNNLQIVASLLNLQAGRSSNAEVVEALKDTRGRVHSMALLHEALYRGGNLARVDFAVYLEELGKRLCHSVGPPVARIQLKYDVDPHGLPLEQSVPCGLIINELVTNALKHAFPDGRAGCVSVGLRPAEGQTVVLSVRDDGVGLPPSFDPAATATLGMRLISTLATQLGGRLTVTRPPASGAMFTVVFPASTHTQPI